MQAFQCKAETVPFVRPHLPIFLLRTALALNGAGLLGKTREELTNYIRLAKKALNGEVDSVPPFLMQRLEAVRFYLGLSNLNQQQFNQFAEKCARANCLRTGR